MIPQMKNVRILADYYCFAVWFSGESGDENIAPSSQELGLSEPLARDLDHWAAEYSATLREDDPVNSGFESEAAENDFYARGYQLALRVKRELGESWQVSYFDGVLRRDVQIVNELDACTSRSGGPLVPELVRPRGRCKGAVLSAEAEPGLPPEADRMHWRRGSHGGIGERAASFVRVAGAHRVI